MALRRPWARREKYVEAQLAKRLGRAKDAADVAPLDAQQRAEQELYGVPENLKARDIVLGRGSNPLPRGGTSVCLCCWHPVMLSSGWRPCTAYLEWHALHWCSLECPCHRTHIQDHIAPWTGEEGLTNKWPTSGE